MGYIAFIIIAILVTIIACAIAAANAERADIAVAAIIIVAVVAIGAGSFLFSVTSIPTGYTGILTTFGRVENLTLDAGFRMKSPCQSVIKMDNRLQKDNVKLSCFSSDIQEVEISYTLNYQINKENAMNIYRSIGTEYYARVIEPAISEAVKIVIARYTAEDLISNRADITAQIEALLSENLNTYDIKVVGTAIEDMDFTEAFTNAVEQKQVAAQNKLQAEIEQEQKTMEQEAEAARAVIDANAAAEVARIQAEADLEVTKIQADAAEYAGQKEAAKNKAVAESLTPELVDYYYIQQWDGQLPSSYVGSENPNTIVTVR